MSSYGYGLKQKVIKIYGFPTQDNGCALFRIWQPLDALARNGLADVRRDPDKPQSISIIRCEELFNWCDVMWIQPFSELWAASIFVAARDVTKKKLIVDLDDNIWSVHPTNVGDVRGRLMHIKSQFSGEFKDYWKIEDVTPGDEYRYSSRLDGTLVQDSRTGAVQFLHQVTPDLRLTVEFLLEQADAVTTTNSYLANVIRQHTRAPVHILPNCLDRRNWSRAIKREAGGDKCWISWCGSVSHYADLQPLMPVLDRLISRYPHVNVQIMGSSFDYLFPVKPNAKRMPVEGYDGSPSESPMYFASYEDTGERWPERMRFDKPVPIQEYFRWMNANWRGSIGIAPLIDNEFNNSKSELKWLEYSALHTPTVASCVGPYARAIESGVDGEVATSPAEWEFCLSELIKYPEFRAKLASQAHERVWREYDQDHCAPKWLRVAESVL